MVEQGLLQLLGQSSAVTSLIPNDVAGTPQIYFQLAPKGAKLPYIVITRIITNDFYTFQGSSGLREGLFQVACYTDSKAGTAAGYYTSRQISAAARSTLESYRGNLPDS